MKKGLRHVPLAASEKLAHLHRRRQGSSGMSAFGPKRTSSHTQGCSVRRVTRDRRWYAVSACPPRLVPVTVPVPRPRLVSVPVPRPRLVCPIAGSIVAIRLVGSIAIAIRTVVRPVPVVPAPIRAPFRPAMNARNTHWGEGTPNHRCGAVHGQRHISIGREAK
jgi:hypothetical protein